MSIDVRIQSKAADILEAEAKFFNVHPTAIVKAAVDKLAGEGLLRSFMQGVDVSSYQERKRGRPVKKAVKK